MQHLQKTRGRGQLLLTRNPKRIPVLSERSESKDLSSHATKRVDPERELTQLLGFPSRPPNGTEGWKQMSFQAVLNVERGGRYGWKLPTRPAGRLAYAGKECRFYLRGRALARSGHRRQRRHLHHYQRRLPPSPPRRATLPARRTVYTRHLNSLCSRQPPAHLHFAP